MLGRKYRALCIIDFGYVCELYLLIKSVTEFIITKHDAFICLKLLFPKINRWNLQNLNPKTPIEKPLTNPMTL